MLPSVLCVEGSISRRPQAFTETEAQRSLLRLLPASAMEETKKRPQDDHWQRIRVSVPLGTGAQGSLYQSGDETTRSKCRPQSENGTTLRKLAGWDVRKGGPAIKPEKVQKIHFDPHLEQFDLKSV